MLTPTTERSNRPLKSMTGFGRGRQIVGDVEIATEIRAVNHRFLDVSLRLPRTYSAFEPEIRRIISQRVQRGKLDVALTRMGGRGVLVDVMLDQQLAENYYRCLVRMKEHFGLSGDIRVSDMLTLSDIVVPVEKQEAIDQEWPYVETSLRDALTTLDEMRCTEGATLWQDIVPRLAEIESRVELISALAGQVTAEARERLEKRVQVLTNGLEFDENRLLQEVALIADRSDVTEELTRLKSHVDQFRSLGEGGSPLGRKLDFLLQELLREANTVGSKSASTEISSHVVGIKAELEKIREQVQNIE